MSNTKAVKSNTEIIEQESFASNLIFFVKGSLIFVVSQAWNSAIQDLIQRTAVLSEYGPLIYAIFITFMAVYILKIISNLTKMLNQCDLAAVGSKCIDFGKLWNLREFFSNSKV